VNDHDLRQQEPTATPHAPGRAGRRAEGERRIITVLFCDVVNSTAMAERLDPEEWTEIMNEAFHHLTAPITRYEGTVARLMGDGVLAFFGAPVAHEDDPQRAILAALDIVGGIRAFHEQMSQEYGLDFNVRVGINTGPVVVGVVGSAAAKEYTAMGDAVNMAARMEQTAKPGTIQISEDTHRLVAPLFDFESLGGIEVKGKSTPVPAYRVLGVRAQPGRLRGIEGVSARLIGRDHEFAQLKDVLEQLSQGRGQIVCLSGEPGIGKSRLIEELHEEWGRRSSSETWFQAQGIAYDSARPYSLFQELARRQFGVQLDDSADVIHQKVDTGLRASGLPEEHVALCSVAVERIIAAKVLHDAPDFAGEVVQQDIFERTYEAWNQAAATAPVVLAMDDLHWADQASVELLMHLFQMTEEVPILFLCAFRPERQSAAWQLKQKAETDYPHRYTEIVLHPLGSEDADALVSALLNIADLPEELRKLILRKAEGNPYFVEEVVRSLIDQGIVYRTEDGLRWKASTSVEDITIPDSLHAVLASRLDRLDQEVRSTLQLAAVIGRSFYHRILNAMSDSAVAVDKHLSALQRVELVRETARVPELQYIFKHELARDAAYGTILHRRRRDLHRRVGEAIEDLFPDKLEENAHRLAYHFAQVGDDERALKYYAMAADSASGVNANTEAAGHYRPGH
jgi:class 3 adenylate cyclase